MPSTVSRTGYRNRRLEPGVWMPEHVLVAESTLGVKLPEGGSVHHRNGIRSDNRPENLEMFAGAHGAGVRLTDQLFCPHCMGRL